TVATIPADFKRSIGLIGATFDCLNVPMAHLTLLSSMLPISKDFSFFRRNNRREQNVQTNFFRTQYFLWPLRHEHKK
ncbi:MAG: hypothetical protein WAK95_11840, partial [Desulfobacterales bacterium]